jgi:hypothetical protein
MACQYQMQFLQSSSRNRSRLMRDLLVLLWMKALLKWARKEWLVNNND